MRAKKYTKETILNMGMEDRKFAKFNVGDAVTVAQRIKEGDKERIQIFEGDVIVMHNNGISSTFTVRKNWCKCCCRRAYIPLLFTFN